MFTMIYVHTDPERSKKDRAHGALDQYELVRWHLRQNQWGDDEDGCVSCLFLYHVTTHRKLFSASMIGTWHQNLRLWKQWGDGATRSALMPNSF